ncbi:MAG: hypothetical protein WD512_15725 [Candidatus Paceibacterota bacterium]
MSYFSQRESCRSIQCGGSADDDSTYDAKLAAIDQARADDAQRTNKPTPTPQGSCQSDKDCMGSNVCVEKMCVVPSWYQVVYWGLPLWGWILIGIILALIGIGIGIYFAVPYIELAIDGGNQNMSSGTGASPLNDMGSMTGTTPGYPGSATL